MASKTRNNARARGDKRITQRAVNAKVEVHIDRVIELTMLGNDIKTIAEKMGLKPTTIRDIRQRADYRERYEYARNEALKLTLQRLTAMQAPAVNAALEILSAKRRVVEGEGESKVVTEEYKYPAKDRIRVLENILDRTGAPRQTKVEQTGEVTVNQATVDMTPFNGRSIEEKRHYLEHGVFPDGSKPVAQ